MAYSAISFIRELSPLLTDTTKPTDAVGRRFIRKGEASKIEPWLKPRYKIPLQPVNFSDGTLSVTADSTTVTGTGTSFTSDLQINDTIQVWGTKEPLRVASITSDTELEATSAAVTTASASLWWKLPDEIVTASEFISGWLLIKYFFPEKISNQDRVNDYAEFMAEMAGAIIEQLQNGDYFNSDLEEAATADLVNQPSYDDTSDLRELIEDHDNLLSSTNFIL